MPCYFVDTSALVKRYLPETGSEWILDLFERDGATFGISSITVVELASTLGRKRREGAIDDVQRDTQFRQFLLDSADIEIVPVDEELIIQTSQVLLSGLSAARLRSLDALQLASARRWFEKQRAVNIEPGVFVVADEPLRLLAGELGFRTEDPEAYA